MVDVALISQQMRTSGLSEKEISYAVKPLELASEALTNLLDKFDNTPLPYTIDLSKLRLKND